MFLPHWGLEARGDTCSSWKGAGHPEKPHTQREGQCDGSASGPCACYPGCWGSCPLQGQTELVLYSAGLPGGPAMPPKDRHLRHSESRTSPVQERRTKVSYTPAPEAQGQALSTPAANHPPKEELRGRQTAYQPPAWPPADRNCTFLADSPLLRVHLPCLLPICTLPGQPNVPAYLLWTRESSYFQRRMGWCYFSSNKPVSILQLVAHSVPTDLGHLNFLALWWGVLSIT